MGKPLVIAYHLMWTCYGCWLPNDPRGSTSSTVHAPAIAALGPLHHGRRALQPAGREFRAFLTKADAALQYERLEFHPHEFPAVAKGLGGTIAEHRYTCYAAVVMPDHVHVLIRKHRHTTEEMIEHFKARSAARLRAGGTRSNDHPVRTASGGWKVFLDHPDDVRRTIAYIERNPAPRRLPRQQYGFVTPYDGWPLHPGHSHRSPYVRALRAAGRL